MKTAANEHSYLLSLFFRHKESIAVILFLQMACALLIAIQPFLFQRLVASVLTGPSPSPLSTAVSILAALLVLYLLTSLVRIFGGIVACRFSSNLLEELQIAFFQQLCSLPLQYFRHHPTGEFMTKFTSDVAHTQSLVCHLGPAVLRESIIILAVTAILLSTCPIGLTAAALLVVGSAVILIYLLNKTLEKYAARQRRNLSDINKAMDETVQGIDTFKIYSGEKQRVRYFRQKTASFREVSVTSGILASTFAPLIELVSKTGTLLLLAAAYVMSTREQLPTERFLLFFFYIGLLESASVALINTLSNIQPQLVCAGELADFFGELSEDGRKETGPTHITVPADIELSRLSFSYPGRQQLFDNLNLRIPARAITVIQGPSGSGKSTLINLLLRFYPVGKGTIRVGEHNINRIPKTELRSQVGVVPQFHFILHDTLRSNVAIADTEVSDDEILRVIGLARLQDFLSRQPDGLDQILDPRGKGISGGEKQRLSIARLLVRKTPIVILDEPWSNLDQATRDPLINLVNQWKQSATIVIFTHTIPDTMDIDARYDIGPAGQTS